MADSLPPSFDEGRTYLCSGKLLNALLNEIRSNKVTLEPGTGLAIKQTGPDTGTVIGLDDTAVCAAPA